MEGPLPLELQQIRADTQREEAALEAAKAALAAQRRKSEVSYQAVAIRLKIIDKHAKLGKKYLDMQMTFFPGSINLDFAMSLFIFEKPNI